MSAAGPSLAAAAETDLQWMLRPVAPILADPALTNFNINGVGEGMAFVTRNGRPKEQITLPYSFRDLEDIAVLSAALTGQDIDETAPLLSTRFPDGHRVQVVRPPCVEDGHIAISVRRPQAATWTPAELERRGVFADTRPAGEKPRSNAARLARLYRRRRWREFLELAVASGLVVVFSGPVDTGKTTMLRSFTHCINPHWRVVSVQNVHELLDLPCADVVHLLCSKGGQSSARGIEQQDLIEAALRMGMRGLLLQELLDGDGAFAWFSAVRTGHWGMTTVHADSAGETRERIRGLVKEHAAGRHLDDATLDATLARLIDVVAHCVQDEDGTRRVAEILYDPRDAPDEEESDAA